MTGRVTDALRARFADGVVLEDFAPLYDSLELKVGRAYWEDNGLQSFLARDVPSDITNDGVRAAQAAQVLFAQCEEDRADGAPEQALIVVEMGVGLGLFARLLMRQFSKLCDESGRDYFTRLKYYASDISRSNIDDIRRLGTLDEFSAQVYLGQLDALCPQRFKPEDGGAAHSLPGRVQMVLHNYLLDTLPSTQVLYQNGAWYQLHLQTRLLEPWRVEAFDPDQPQAFVTAVKDGQREALDALREAWPYIAVERSFFPLDITTLAHTGVVQRFCSEWLAERSAERLRMWVPFGAMNCCRRVLDLLRPGGCVLYCDYGTANPDELEHARDYQRYGAGICVGLNLPLLDAYCHELDAQLSVPEGDDQLALHARLLSVGERPKTRAAFRDAFCANKLNALNDVCERARASLGRGQVDEALDLFEQAAAHCPQNWSVLGEMAHVANQAQRPIDDVIRLVRRALEINPSCSADLWNEYGDVLLRADQPYDAEQAYQTALSINPTHSRSYFNLARTFSTRGDFDVALSAIAQSLSCDRAGQHTDLLLDQQAQLLASKHAAHHATQRIAGTRSSWS